MPCLSTTTNIRIRNRTVGSSGDRKEKRARSTGERIENAMCAPVAQIVESSAAITGHYHSHRVLLPPYLQISFFLRSCLLCVCVCSTNAQSSSMVVRYLDEMFLVHSKVCDRLTCVPFLATYCSDEYTPSNRDTPHDDN